MDYTLLKGKEKYDYLLDVLEKVKTYTLYKNEKIEDNPELMNQRESDIQNLKKIINDELKKDNIKFIAFKGRKLYYNPDLDSFDEKFEFEE